MKNICIYATILGCLEICFNEELSSEDSIISDPYILKVSYIYEILFRVKLCMSDFNCRYSSQLKIPVLYFVTVLSKLNSLKKTKNKKQFQRI